MCLPLDRNSNHTATVHPAPPSPSASDGDTRVDELSALATRALHIAPGSTTPPPLAEKVTTPKAALGGCGGSAGGASAAERPAVGGAGISADTAASAPATTPAKEPISLMLSKNLIIPDEVTISILQSLYGRFKEGLFSFSDYAEVEKQTLELLEDIDSAEWVELLLHSTRQFAEFQTLKEHLPKTNELKTNEDKEKEAVLAQERKIISNLEKQMDSKSLKVSNAVTLYLWTLDQIVEESIPPSEYIQVYRYVTNYVTIRTHSRDWSANEMIVMKNLVAALNSKTINIEESEDTVMGQLDLWLPRSFAAYKIPPDQQKAITERASTYVRDYRNTYLAFKKSIPVK